MTEVSASETGMGGAPEGGLASSLVPSSESVDEIDVPEARQVCPKRPQLVVCDQDPSLRFPASCDAYRCSVCGTRKALQAAAIAAWGIRHADRGRFVTLTLMPEDWQTRRQKMRDLRRLLGRRGLNWECAWTTEQGSLNGMTHVHALQHGSYVPQRLLQEVVGTRVDIREIKTGGVAQYVTKEALKVAGYAVKEATAEHSGLERHLELNGGRAIHMTRGFLHGLTKRGALTDLKAELNQGENRTWHLEPAIDPATLLTPTSWPPPPF